MKQDKLLKLRSPIDEKCKGCSRTEMIDGNELCRAYIDPPLKWRLGDCGLATHIISEAAAKKKKLNPIKQSKRG